MHVTVCWSGTFIAGDPTKISLREISPLTVAGLTVPATLAYGSFAAVRAYALHKIEASFPADVVKLSPRYAAEATAAEWLKMPADAVAAARLGADGYTEFLGRPNEPPYGERLWSERTPVRPQVLLRAVADALERGRTPTPGQLALLQATVEDLARA